MQPEEPIIPREWYQFAERDLDRTHRMLEDDDFPGAALHLQQAVEKYLKGFLLSKGWHLRRTHDLEALLNEAIHYVSDLELFRIPCIRMTQYYLFERYPGSVSMDFTRQELEESLTQARALIESIKKLS